MKHHDYEFDPVPKWPTRSRKSLGELLAASGLRPEPGPGEVGYVRGWPKNGPPYEEGVHLRFGGNPVPLTDDEWWLSAHDLGKLLGIGAGNAVVVANKEGWHSRQARVQEFKPNGKPNGWRVKSVYWLPPDFRKDET